MKALLLMLQISIALSQTELTLEQRVEDFKKITGFKLGSYELVKGPGSCQVGELKGIMPESATTLMLGNQALVFYLGTQFGPVDDDGCQVSYSSKYLKGKLTASIREVCKKSVKSYFVNARLTETGFVYERTILQDKRRIFYESCTLRLAN